MGRLLVATGEIQSTNLRQVQNSDSLYAVGSLLHSDGKPILYLTIYKWKTAQLSIVRLTLTSQDNVMAIVSLKYVGSPSLMNLQTLTGIKTLASRLHTMLLQYDQQ